MSAPDELVIEIEPADVEKDRLLIGVSTGLALIFSALAMLENKQMSEMQ